MFIPFEQCPYLTIIPTVLNLFDFSYAPTLLFYSYIPISIFSILFGFFVFLNNKSGLLNKLLFCISLLFCFFLLNEIVQWIAVNANVIVFSWSLSPLIQIALWISVVYFIVVFFRKGDITFGSKVLLFLPVFIILLLLPTRFNISSFDPINCEAISGNLWNIMYVFQFLILVWIVYFGVKNSFSKNDRSPRFTNLTVIIGSFLFLSIFLISNFYGEITKIFEVNLVGPIGMVIFMGFLSYLIVKYKTFNVKLIAAQALVWGMIFLIGSQFFFIKTTTNYLLAGITFVAIVVFGRFLVKSVKKEIQQKEQLAKLNIDLKDLIKQRESLVHLVTHKVKGSFTRSKYIFGGILEGMFGDVSEEVKKRAAQGLESDNMGIETVDLVLNAANLQKGTIKYEMKNIDLKDLVLKTVSEKKISAEAKGLKLETKIADESYAVSGDTFWLKEVLNNLVENSIKYTKEGKITVRLEDGNGKIKLSVRDTGIGITDEDKKYLFTEGGRGKDSVKMNVDSTGYGLYSVRLILEAHKGKIWMSPNKEDGRGTIFFVELDAV